MFPPAALPHHLNLDDIEPLMYVISPCEKMLELFSNKLRTIVCYQLLWKAMCRKYLAKSMNCCLIVLWWQTQHESQATYSTISIYHNQPYFPMKGPVQSICEHCHGFLETFCKCSGTLAGSLVINPPFVYTCLYSLLNIRVYRRSPYMKSSK